MNTSTPAATIPSATRRFFSSRIQVSVAALSALLAVDAGAQTFSWANTDTTTPPGATQAWSIGANWGGTTPTANSTVNAFRGTGPAYIFLDTVTNAVGTTSVNYGTELWISSTGEFINGLSGRMDIGVNTASTVNVAAGGKITLATGTLGSNVRLRLQNGSTLNTAGVIDHNVLLVDGGSTVNLTGGSITTRQTFSGTQVLSSNFVQSGGDLVTSSVLITKGNYTVSGGTITTNTANDGLYFTGGDTTTGSKFSVIGSAATINFSSFRNNDTGTGVVRPTFAFTLDNSAAHISKINFAANGNTGGILRTNANLEVKLKGGILLTSTNSYTIIQRVSGTDTAWLSGPGPLWVDATDNTSTTSKANINIAFNASASRGALDAEGPGLDLGAAFNHGFVTLSNVAFDETLLLGLDISGGTLSLFTTALTQAGIAWTAGVGDYEVLLELAPSVSGGNYFAWDLSTIDATMGVQGLGVVSSVPEPSAFAALAGLAGLGFTGFRRRRRA